MKHRTRRMNYQHRAALGAAIAVFALAAGACTSDSRTTTGATDVSTADTTDTTGTATADTTVTSGAGTTVAPTTAAPATAAPTTAAPAPTTAAPAPALPLLHSTGIGTASFGDTDDDVLALLGPAYGGISTDTSEAFPVNMGVDEWQTADGEMAYTAPLARTVCLGNGVCAVFGGPAAADLRFTGWYLNDATAPVPATVEGIHLGDLWSAHTTAITRLPGGCYSYGSGTSTDGINIGMTSTGEMFNFYDDASGTWMDGNPDPANVQVVGMDAGDLVAFLFADC